MLGLPAYTLQGAGKADREAARSGAQGQDPGRPAEAGHGCVWAGEQGEEGGDYGAVEGAGGHGEDYAEGVGAEGGCWDWFCLMGRMGWGWGVDINADEADDEGGDADADTDTR